MLNTKQQQVIDELTHNILLSAGAGTGKTNVLGYRIVNILNKKLAKPEEILCLTFTNRACRELKERITSLVDIDDATKMTLRTIHGFAYQIIIATAKLTQQSFKEYVIFDDEDQKTLLGEVLQKYPKAKVLSMQYIVDSIEMLKQERALQNIYTQDLQADYTAIYHRHLQFNRTFNQQQSDTLSKFFQFDGLKVITLYETLLQQMNGLDYKDLIANSYRLLQSENIKKLWQEKYKYIMIDEMQDTSSFEYAMLEKLFSGKNIMLCGDEFQTIYQWRGSNPQKVLHDFTQKYAPITISFNENYRSTKLLLEMAYNTLINLFHKDVIEHSYVKNMIAKSTERGSKIPFKQFKNQRAEAEWIFQHILSLKPLINSYSDIVILARQNKYITNLAEHLNHLATAHNLKNPENHLYFIQIDNMRFFKRQEIKDVIAIMKFLLNNSDYFSLQRILVNLIPNIGLKTIEQIRSIEYLNAGIRLSDFLNPQLKKQQFDPYSSLIHAYHAKDIIVFDIEATGTDIFSDNIIQLSAVKIRRGIKIATFNKYLQSEKSVGKSEKVHHISDEYLQKYGENSAQVLLEFKEFLKNALITGHNIRGYDMDILNQNLIRRNLSPVDFSAINYDTLDLARRFYPNLLNHKLEYLSHHFNLETKSTHNALDDVLATWNLLAKIIEEKIIPTSKSRTLLIEKQKHKFVQVAEKFNQLHDKLTDTLPLQDLISEIVKLFNLAEIYKAKTLNGQNRLENLRQLYRIAKEELSYQTGRQAVSQLLQYAILSSNDLDALTKSKPKIPIITVHQAKGLEFQYEFLAGMNDDVFPSYQSTKNSTISEEEKRLFYVAITRAKKKLYLSSSAKESRLLKQIPEEFIEKDT